MARLAGINIPDDKHTEISLTYIYGIGRTTAKALCEKTGISGNAKVGELTEGPQRKGARTAQCAEVFQHGTSCCARSRIRR